MAIKDYHGKQLYLSWTLKLLFENQVANQLADLHKHFEIQKYLKICIKNFSFFKLIIKVKKRIVADGLTEIDFDSSKVGNHLNADQWNDAIDKGAVIVDMRNHYESEIGHFKNAILPQSETFKEELPMVK